MITYEQLLMEADRNCLIQKKRIFQISKGRIKGNRIAINKSLTEQEKKCILAEQLGHYYTESGDILDQSSASNRKQESHGRIMAYNRLIGLMGIINSYNDHCQSLSEGKLNQKSSQILLQLILLFNLLLKIILRLEKLLRVIRLPFLNQMLYKPVLIPYSQQIILPPKMARIPTAVILIYTTINHSSKHLTRMF